jgi:uncharacterized protein YeaO (DUF488 family)
VIKLKRVYEPPAAEDGARYLVERLWPRGVRKEGLVAEDWLKDAGPSTELRKWFAHDPAKWDEFRRRYFAELESKPERWQQLAEASRRGTVTLLYTSHDSEHNNAVALKDYLEHHAGGGRRRPARRGGTSRRAR